MVEVLCKSEIVHMCPLEVHGELWKVSYLYFYGPMNVTVCLYEAANSSWSKTNNNKRRLAKTPVKVEYLSLCYNCSLSRSPLVKDL